MKKIFLLFSIYFLAFGPGENILNAQSLSSFQDCISNQSYGNCTNGVGTMCTCQLWTSSAPYDIGSPLTIRRSGIVVTGGSSDPTATTLRRGSSSLSSIMIAAPGVTNVTVQRFTFDGNRYGFGTHGAGISCQLNQFILFDLLLNQGGNFTVQWNNFINSPDTAVQLGGGSTLSFSNFGQNGTGQGPNGQYGAESGSQTATRFTAVDLHGSASAYYNDVAYAGTAGIALNGGYNQIAYGNRLFQDRYEVSDGSGGGMFTIWNGTSYASVAGNVINGNLWPSFYPYTLDTGCPIRTSGNPNNAGIEANGIGNRFFNNEVTNNWGGGIVYNLDNAPAGQVTISSSNPWYSGDTPRYVEFNKYTGITFHGPPQFSSVVQGVLLDDVLVSNNAVGGVYFQNVADAPGYTGFTFGACMNNDGTTVGWETPIQHIPTNSVPGNYNSYRGGNLNCPATGSLTPAPSSTPGWKW